MAEFLETYSYIGLFVVLVLTGCGLPIPEEVPIIAAGVAASLGNLDPWLAFICCLAGALVGDMIMYAIGRTMGRGIRRHPWLARLLHAENEARTAAMIKKHGLKVFLVARFLVGIRAPMYVSSGMLRVPFSRFVLIDAICATLVVGLVFGLSYIYGEHFVDMWEWIHQSQLKLTIFILIAVVIIGLGVWHWRRRRQSAIEAQRVEDCLIGEDDHRRDRPTDADCPNGDDNHAESQNGRQRNGTNGAAGDDSHGPDGKKKDVAGRT